MILKKLQAFMSVCLVLALCGCMGYREIDKGYFVTAMGFSGQNGSASILIEAMSSSDVVNTDSERVVLSGSGNNTQQAYENLKSTLAKPLYFEQLGTVIFEGEIEENLNFIRRIPNINYGIYIVKTDDIKSLFEGKTVNGVLGYDIISLIKTQQKQNDIKAATQFYKVQNAKENLPVVNFVEDKLLLKLVGESR